MFRKSKNSQGDLFTGLSSHLSSRKQKLLSDPKGWHKFFHEEVLSRIEEEVYAVLFSETGRPNASLRVLVGMMILKEGNGWSDEQLFEECRFNIKVMMALGYMNLDEDIPVESTYYLFRKLLTSYNEKEGIDLLKISFGQITQAQINAYHISGKKIRLDSKLINSNIALCTRLDLIIETVRCFTKGLDLAVLSGKLELEDYDLLVQLKEKTTTNLTYSLSKQDKSLLLVRMGKVIKNLLLIYPQATTHYADLERLYEEHYREISKTEDKEDKDEKGDQGIDQVELKPSKEVDSSSLQSIHDPQATFRSKGHGNKKQHISGYHANITETCDEENKINLIVDVILEKANVNEDEFLLAAIASSEELFKNSQLQEEELSLAQRPARIIEQATTDGGYDSIENRKSMSKKNMPQWNMAKNKGKAQRFKMYYDQQGKLQVIDKKTGERCELNRNRKGDKIGVKFKTDKPCNRQYFTDEQIENYIILQNLLEGVKQEDKNLRANVESTIHQSFHRLLKRNKVKYRGQYKSKMYVISRAIWVNFRRICKGASQSVKSNVIALITALNFLTMRYRLI